jgi:NTP pyrophosphatase (non-canonical NTP hydrolase)
MPSCLAHSTLHKEVTLTSGILNPRERSTLMATQPTLLGLEVAASPSPRRRRRELSLAEVNSWARRQVSWIARRAQADRSSELFLYTQAAKLVEEVGELHAQLLGRSKLQRRGKGQEFNQACLEGEFADVVICTVILAQVAGVDLGKALVAKMEAVDERVAAENLTDAV